MARTYTPRDAHAIVNLVDQVRRVLFRKLLLTTLYLLVSS